MRFKANVVGDRRMHHWFAFLPVTVGRESRWLETISAEQEYRYLCGGLFGWETIRFLD